MTTKSTTATKETRVVPRLSPIAVIGLSGILPDAENIDQYWQNILDEVNCIKEVPPSRWSIEDHYDPDPTAPDKSYCKYGGFIPDILFDPMEFGLPPNILEVTDVSQLLSLNVAKNALKDAGYLNSPESILDHTGVILGMVGMSSKVIHPLLNRLQYPVWEKVLRSCSLPETEIPIVIEKMKSAYIQWNENAFPGAIGNVVAGRIANRLDLGGANCIVDAACASSLAAVSMAISELALGKADMMITGGVDTDNSILTYLCFSKTPAFSKGGNLRAFSEDSDGMLTGEGIGMLVLKRLDDAERDNDRIYAVIRGIGASSDGHFKSIYAPRSSGQAKAIRRAYQQAHYDSSTVRFIEAHGTGTIAGDPAEFEGLTEAFSEMDSASQVIALGSIKSQIGHTKATAGTASLIKASLALHQKILPATINVSKPHPAMEIESTPFYLNTETRPWLADTSGFPRRAGVSSFGFGGTNFHIALEEYQGNDNVISRRREVPYSIILSTENPTQLLETCRETEKALHSPNAKNELIQLDIDTHTKKVPLKRARIGFVALSIADALEKLTKCISMLEGPKIPASWSNPQGIFFRTTESETEGKVVALFPGQGSQYINMGREIVLNFPNVREAFEKTDQIYSKSFGKSLTGVVYPIPVFTDEDRKQQSQNLTKTSCAQPAIGTLSFAFYQLLADAGFKADHYAGHSFGELSALWASGVYDREAFIRLAIERGKAMDASPSSSDDSGKMIAVKGDIDKLQKLLADQDAITIANFNSPTQVVLAGASDDVASMKEKLEGLGFSVFQLQVSAAFHTPFVAHAQVPFKKAIKKETFNQPSKSVYSNTTARKYNPDPEQIAKNLSDHILNSVCFKEEIENIYQNGGRIFIEIGPKRILTNLVKDILYDLPHETVTLNPNPKGDSDLQFRQAVVQMRVLGIDLQNIDPHRIYQYQEPTKLSKVTVTLNGGLYTTQKTKDAFQRALNKPSSASAGIEPTLQETSQQSTKPSLKTAQKLHMGERNPSQIEVSNMNDNYQEIPPLLEKLQEHQNNILHVHQLFLNNNNTSNETIKEIVSTEISVLSKLNSNPTVSNNEHKLTILGKRVESINKRQNGITQAHLDFIHSQSEFTKQYAILIGQLVNINDNGMLSPTQQLSTPVKTQLGSVSPVIVQHEPIQSEIVKPESDSTSSGKAKPQYDQDQLTSSFLEIVSNKTGYPTDILELNMDMEADLGIDSIKRVEILGAMQEEYPQLPTIPAEDLVELRTLEQIIAAFGSISKQVIETPTTTEKPMEIPQIEAAPTVSVGSLPDANLQLAFLDIVSEKTGYPPDMLELEMDMEADLGIDSIKRVEILGAMQEQFPNLPTIDAEELVELRTLKQIIERFNSGQSQQPARTTEISSSPNSNTAKSEEVQLKRREVTLKTIPDPDFLKFDLKPDSLVLITDEGSDKTEKLSNYFAQQNVQIGLIHFNDPPKGVDKKSKNGFNHFYFPDADDSEVQSCMQAIIDQYKEISAFIHLNPESKGNGKGLLSTSEVNTRILKTVFLIARQLGKPLTETGENNRSAFLTITNLDGQLGINGSTSNDPIPGGFSGLTKSLRLEWPGVFCRAIDIHPEINTDTVVNIIHRELHDPDTNLAEVGYTQDRRYTLTTK